MMVSTIDSLSGTSNARIFWDASSWHSQNANNAKKVIAWSRDCGMDQYVSWNLSSDELTLETIWGKYEDYCKPQSNEVWARFDLLTSFRQGNHSIEEWYNSIQAQVNLAKYPQKQPKYSIGTSFGFS